MSPGHDVGHRLRVVKFLRHPDSPFDKVDALAVLLKVAGMNDRIRIGWCIGATAILALTSLALASVPAMAQNAPMMQGQPAQPGAPQPAQQGLDAGVPPAPPPTIIHNKIAVFAALNKVTARISHLEIPIGKSEKFGTLTVTPRVCDTRPPTEQPHTVAFVEVDETKLNGEKSRIFTGWMFAESPGLNAVEHPVYDVWLTACKMPIGEASSGNASNAPSPSDNASSKSR